MFQKLLGLIKIKALMIKINVIVNNSHWYKIIKNPSNYINRKINKLNFKYKKYSKNIIFCTLLLAANKEIKKLNKKFRKKNKITDVLSFPFQKKNELKRILKVEKEIYLGDIIINYNKIKSKKNFHLEFNKLWIHGLIHLFGYDHKTEKDFREMNRVEKKFTKFING